MCFWHTNWPESASTWSRQLCIPKSFFDLAEKDETRMAFRRGFPDKEGVLYLTHFWQIGFWITFFLWKEREMVYCSKFRWCQNTFQMCLRILLHFKCWNWKQLFPRKTPNLPEALEMHSEKNHSSDLIPLLALHQIFYF